MAVLRIFSYLPNPRIWKATIAARLCGVEVEVRGASPSDLSQWLWDFDARPIADVPPDVLKPRTTWSNAAEYDAQALKLAKMFIDNFKAFEAEVDADVRAAGPRA